MPVPRRVRKQKVTCCTLRSCLQRFGSAVDRDPKQMDSSAAAGSRPVVTKTAEGLGRAEEDLPVDILYSKLIDFLVSCSSSPLPCVGRSAGWHAWHTLYIAAAAISQGSTVLSAQVSRQQLSADWRRRLQVIQSKAAQAWGSLPTHVATSLQPADQLGSDGASPDYFVACQVHHYRLRRPGAHILQAYLAKGSAPCGAGICSLAQPIHGEFEGRTLRLLVWRRPPPA